MTPNITQPHKIDLGDQTDKYLEPPVYRPWGNKVVQPWNDPEIDGLTLNGSGFSHISNLVIGRTGLDPKLADELASVVNGGDVVFSRCRFYDNGKGFLQGNDDTTLMELCRGQRTVFYQCIFEGNSRRNPFIQTGQGYLIQCLIRNWGQNFHGKSFGVRAGKDGQVTAVQCIFEQESFWTCLKRGNTLRDVLGQYLWPLPGLPGFMRAAYADTGGHVQCFSCHKNHWWLYMQNHKYSWMSPPGSEKELRETLERVVPKAP